MLSARVRFCDGCGKRVLHFGGSSGIKGRNGRWKRSRVTSPEPAVESTALLAILQIKQLREEQQKKDFEFARA